MLLSFVCLVLLVKFVTCTGSKHCISGTVRGANQYVCCADYELKGGDCIACSKGYTSHLGQNCQPCMKNTYGERCRYDCSCQVDETCDNAEGCLKIRTSAGFPIHNTSASDTTALPGGKNEISTSGNSAEGLLATEIIVYYIVSVIVLNIGVIVCFIFYKYKLAARKKKTTIN